MQVAALFQELKALTVESELVLPGSTLPVQSNLRTGNVSTESESGLLGGMKSWRFRIRREALMNHYPCGLPTEPTAETIRRRNDSRLTEQSCCCGNRGRRAYAE